MLIWEQSISFVLAHFLDSLLILVTVVIEQHAVRCVVDVSLLGSLTVALDNTKSWSPGLAVQQLALPSWELAKPIVVDDGSYA